MRDSDVCVFLLHNGLPIHSLTFVFYEKMKRMALERQRETRVSERNQELIDIFNEWDSGQRGTLSTDELQHMMKFVFPPSLNDMFLTNLQQQQFLAEDLRYLTQRYRVEDAIDFEAFEVITRQLEVSMRDHQLRAAFAFFDTKGDGVIDREELYAGLAALEFPHQSDKDGHLKASKLSLLTDHLLALGDTSHHSTITYSSFGIVYDDIRAIQMRKKSKLDARDHTV